MSTLSTPSITYNSTLTRATFSCDYDLDYSSAYRRIKAKFGGYEWVEYLGQGSSFSGTFERSNLNTRPGESYSWWIRVQYCNDTDDPNVESNWKPSTLYKSGTSQPMFSVFATIVYDPNGGTGGPGTQYLSDKTTSSSGANIGFAIPSTVPTRSGYTFAGWLFPSGYTWHPGDSTVVWGTQSGTSYTATAQWTQDGAKIYIDNGTSWVEYRAYIDNGSGWDAVTPSIDNGTNWG